MPPSSSTKASPPLTYNPPLTTQTVETYGSRIPMAVGSYLLAVG